MTDGELHEFAREAQRLRTVAMEAMFRVELLTDSAELSALVRCALKAADRLHSGRSREELAAAREESRTLVYDFIAAARAFVPGLIAG
ncbi:hypothetical protein ABT009_27265 [Streptomyces sp. NPDC002896]|uniref:hypothetical protein n=1 Tax=Streptomyces sp. NPDC002896 TaxID=3154438 RepID=UPI00332FCA6B